MTQVLVTGAAGFIGSHFLDACRDRKWEDINVGGVVDKISYSSNIQALKNIRDWKIPFYQTDVRDTSTIIRAIVERDIEIVIHFAAETHVDNSIRDSRPFIDSNIQGTYGVLEACRMTKTKLLHVSTDEVYGPAAAHSFLESDKLNPKNPYAATKAAAEHLVESYGNTFGLDYLIVRPSNNFGPRQHIEKFVPKYITNVLAGRIFPLYGDGQQVREWFYVKDNARMIRELAIRLSANRENRVPDRILNLGNPGSALTNIEMCQALHKDLQISIPFENTIQHVDDRLGHDRKYAIDVTKVVKMLSTFHFTPVRQAIRDCVNYYLP